MANRNTLAFVGPYPSYVNNNAAGGSGKSEIKPYSTTIGQIRDGILPEDSGRIQPVIWQPVRNAYLPSSTPANDNRGCARGDLVFDLAYQRQRIFDGIVWRDINEGAGARFLQRTIFDRLVRLTGVNPANVPATDTYDTGDMQDAMDGYSYINNNWIAVGTNVATATQVASTTGGVTFTTAGASADQAILQRNAGASAVYNSSASPIYEWLFSTATSTGTAGSIVSTTIGGGLSTATSYTTPATPASSNDYALIHVTAAASGTAYFTAKYRIAGATAVEVVSAIPLVAATLYHVAIVIDSSRIAWFFVNGVLFAKSTALTTNISLKPHFGVHATAAAAKGITAKAISCSRSWAA